LNSPAMDRQLASTGTSAIPIRLEPEFVERVWGAPRDSEAISLLYPPAPGGPERIGEVWLTGNKNRIANGTWAGRTLQELTDASGALLLGENLLLRHPSGRPVFPLLVKFLFTTDKLSVQVHPPDEFAKGLGSWGKTEMWHILRAAAGARLAIGFRADVPPKGLTDPAKLREAARSGAIEHWLDWQEVHAGETYFVPAGTVHAIGAGITLCEIQQNSDITYRLYDYNRPGTGGAPRALHLAEALEVIRPRTEGGRTAAFDWSSESGARQLLAVCPYFATERWELPEGAERSPGNHLEIWIALQGAAAFEAGGSSVMIRAGEVVVIPAAASFTIRPDAASVFLRTYPPDWEKDIVEPLHKLGNTVEQLPRTCFAMTATRPGGAR
jgi:mannose-6-phosphate isomerase